MFIINDETRLKVLVHRLSEITFFISIAITFRSANNIITISYAFLTTKYHLKVNDKNVSVCFIFSY